MKTVAYMYVKSMNINFKFLATLETSLCEVILKSLHGANILARLHSCAGSLDNSTAVMYFHMIGLYADNFLLNKV